MPNRKVTDIEKIKRGYARPSTMSGETLEFEEITEVPPAPQYMEIRAKQYWDRIVPILLGKRVLTIADLESLEVACVMYGKIRQCAEAGMDINAAQVTQFRLFQTEFGLTPASRAKIKAGDDSKGKNPFNANGQKKT